MSHTHDGAENCTCRAPWLDRYDALRAEEEDMDDDPGETDIWLPEEKEPEIPEWPDGDYY